MDLHKSVCYEKALHHINSAEVLGAKASEKAKHADIERLGICLVAS